MLSSVRRCLIQIASFVACVRAMYSASVLESATVCCFLLLQVTEPPEIVKVYPAVERLSSRFPPQLASLYPSNCMSELLYLKEKFIVPLRYLKILLTAIQCAFPGSELY